MRYGRTPLEGKQKLAFITHYKFQLFLKFDPNQPRDNEGRWHAAGGSGKTIDKPNTPQSLSVAPPTSTIEDKTGKNGWVSQTNSFNPDGSWNNTTVIDKSGNIHVMAWNEKGQLAVTSHSPDGKPFVGYTPSPLPQDPNVVGITDQQIADRLKLTNYYGDNPNSGSIVDAFAQHDYAHKNFDYKTQEGAYVDLHRRPAPLADFPQGVQSGDASKVFGFAPAEHIVNPSTGTVFNVTLPNHILHPGVVMRQVVQNQQTGVYNILSTGFGRGMPGIYSSYSSGLSFVFDNIFRERN